MNYDESGWAIVEAAVSELESLIGGRFASGYAIGSLAHGGFAPVVSDVDVAILTEPGPSVERQVKVAVDRVQERMRTGLAERLSVFHAAWPLAGTPGDGSRFPAIDRLDLIEHGNLIAGDDRRRSAAMPSKDEVVLEAIEFFLSRVDVDAISNLNVHEKGVRGTTKIVLAPIRAFRLVETGRVESNDDAVTGYVSSASQSHADLARAALTWRSKGQIADIGAAQKLVELGTAGLYVDVLTRLAERDDIPYADALVDLAGTFAAAP